jgi:hypothetical protein
MMLSYWMRWYMRALHIGGLSWQVRCRNRVPNKVEVNNPGHLIRILWLSRFP